MQTASVANRIESARTRRTKNLQTRRDLIESEALKRELVQLLLKEKKRHSHEMTVQATWIQFLVEIPYQEILGCYPQDERDV